MVQVAEWADSIPETRHCAWVTAYLAGQYQNCRINIDLTGGIGSAIMQAFDDLRSRMRSEEYQTLIRNWQKRRSQRTAPSERRPERNSVWATTRVPGGNSTISCRLTGYLYRRIDSPGPGYQYNTKLGVDLKFKICNMIRE